MKDLDELLGTMYSNRFKLKTQPGQDMEKPPGQTLAGDCGPERIRRAVAAFQRDMQGTPNHAKIPVVLPRIKL